MNISFLYILSSSFIYAKTYNVTLKDALDIALQNNQNAKISNIGVELAELMYKQAVSVKYPTIDLTMNASRLDEDITFEMRGSATFDNTDTINLYNSLSQAYTSAAQQLSSQGLSEASAAASSSANIYKNIASGISSSSNVPISMDAKIMGRDSVVSQLNLAIPLYTGGKISSIVNQAGTAKQISKESKKRSYNEIIFDVKKYYYGLIFAQKLKKLTKDTLDRMEFVHDLTSQLYQGGSLQVKKTDYFRSELSINMIRSYYEVILEKETMARSALLFAMGLSWQDDINILNDSFKEPNIDTSLHELIDNAYRFNPDFNTLKLAINIQNEKIKEVKSEYYPQIGAYGNMQNIYNDYEYGLINDTNKNSWTIGVGLRLSLFDGMRTKNALQQNRLEKIKLQNQQLLLKEGLALELKQAFMALKRSFKRHNILQSSIKTAEDNRDLNTRAYQEDMVETKEVIESQMVESFINADYYKNLFDYSIAKAKIDFIIGNTLEHEIETIKGSNE